MTNTDDSDRQLSRAEAGRLAREDPEALAEATRRGRVADLLSGRDPGMCPTCRRPMTTTHN